ncbi:septum formation initiator [Streptomyces sp. ISL-112]|uniref:FtsB family cell division protein n=1 Tax=unclassified Streptomyces TaxID=2593676 RepID=UPI001BE7C73A|nr:MULTISPECIES: septum formation initiator family protein [unclassified Streptomyces]MBT2425632.1 septum formation initiator [Streptomyces sp. ISL-112]MBT2463761.1 septum formation initiator [Streptomyces sp. ISL-63]
MSRPAASPKGRAGRLAQLMPTASPSSAARTPFVLLVVLLLGGGLITLLLLNSALNEGSFRLSKLKRDTTELTDEQQALQRDVDSYSQPDALERRARELGMVPGGSPAFLNPDGTVRGVPKEAAAPPPSPDPTPGNGAPAYGTDPAAPAVFSGSASPSPGAYAEAEPQDAPALENTPATPPPTTPGR